MEISNKQMQTVIEQFVEQAETDIEAKTMECGDICLNIYDSKGELIIKTTIDKALLKNGAKEFAMQMKESEDIVYR